MTADLAVFAAHGLFGCSAVSALTVQSTLGVKALYPVDARVLAETLEFLADDLPPVGVKLGMLATEANVLVVVEFLERLRRRERLRRAGGAASVVLDPVVRSSSGRELLSEAGVGLLRERLLPLVDWVTPNLDELGLLTGTEVAGAAEMEGAARRLVASCPGLNVVATGGHLASADDLVVLRDGGAEWLRGEKIESWATHGTGCAFSSALLCGLVEGLDGVAAARQAKGYVAEAIQRAAPLGGGRGPMNLSWPLRAGAS